MYFQVVPGLVAIGAPSVVQQLAPGDDPAGILHQLPENQELLVRQMDWFPADNEPVPIELQLDVTDSQYP